MRDLDNDVHGLLRTAREDNQRPEHEPDGASDATRRPPAPDFGGPASSTAASSEAHVPGDGVGTSGKKQDAWWKGLAVLGAGCLSVGIIVSLLSVLGLSLGLASCMSSCSDRPLGDSREDAAFIADLAATGQDLQVFDALRGSFEVLHDTMERRDQDGVVRTMGVDEMRSQVEAGAWPKDEGQAFCPRVWVRIAELSQAWLEGETGERWEVADFLYPFPNSGPIPVPAVRDEDSRCITRLYCTDGKDEGLYVSVYYYRWAKEAYFEHDLEDMREALAERTDSLSAIDDAGMLGNHQYLLSRGNIYIWDQGEQDELRDPDAFADCVNQMADILGTYAHVTLLAADTPVTVSYDPLSYDYPNDKPLQDMTFDEAHDALLKAGYVLALDHAVGDELLSGYRSQEGEMVTAADLTGMLAEAGQQNWRYHWRAPNEGSVFDDELAEQAAEILGTTPDQLIVASERLDDSFGYQLDVWLNAPRGVFPETPKAFCATVDKLRDAYWEELPEEVARRNTLYVHVTVIDETALVDSGGTAHTFSEMREIAQADPADLEAFEPELLLGCMVSVSQWEEDDEPRGSDCQPKDVDGSIARTRDWRYSDE